MNLEKAKTICLFYSKGKSNIFSGQRIATEILVQGLSNNNWKVREFFSPTFDRLDSTRKFSKVKELTTVAKLLLKLLFLWLNGFPIALSNYIVYVNPGQSTYGLFRDGFPLLIRGILNYYSRGIVSLHGSAFRSWRSNSLEAILLKTIIRGSRFVTVLGPGQRDKLEEFGVSKDKIVQLDNTCLVDNFSDIDISNKHKFIDIYTDHKKTLKVLYLGYLLEAKGYVQFLEAIELVANSCQINLEVILCGQLRTDSAQVPKFANNLVEAREWIEDLIIRVNQSQTVRLRWIEGASGHQKASLFKETHIFVLPSQFRVEAQPLSILEAFAYGCTVITSKAGEIPDMVNCDTAILLDNCCSNSIANAMRLLLENDSSRTQMALQGFELFRKRYAFNIHISNWINLLASF